MATGSQPSFWLRGRRNAQSAGFGVVQLPEMVLLVHEVIVLSTISRRHFPSWTTTARLFTVGTFVRVKLPAASVWVAWMALSAPAPPHVSHVAPVVKAGSAAPGMAGM